MDIYEAARTVSRADLAAWLRQLATQLETTGQVFYGAVGTITVADQVQCELEIEEEDDATGPPTPTRSWRWQRPGKG